MDIFMNKLIDIHEKAKEKFKEVDLLFDCVDLDRNDVMEFNEFIGLYRYIEDVEDPNKLIYI